MLCACAAMPAIRAAGGAWAVSVPWAMAPLPRGSILSRSSVRRAGRVGKETVWEDARGCNRGERLAAASAARPAPGYNAPLQRRQRPVEVGDQVARVLDADGEA